eukprot:Opistho-2@7734
MSKGTSIKDAIARWEEKSGEKAAEAKIVRLVGMLPPIEKMDANLSILISCEQLSISTSCIEKISNLQGLSKLHCLLLHSSLTLCALSPFQHFANRGMDACVCVCVCVTIARPLIECMLSFRYRLRSRIIENLKILSLGRNNIKKLEGLEPVADSLEQLWLSYNQIEKLKGIGSLKKLRILYLSNNKVKEWGEFEKIQELPALEELTFNGNPLEEKCSGEGTWRPEVQRRLPKLKKLDGAPIVSDTPEEEEA